MKRPTHEDLPEAIYFSLVFLLVGLVLAVSVLGGFE